VQKGKFWACLRFVMAGRSSSAIARRQHPLYL